MAIVPIKTYAGGIYDIPLIGDDLGKIGHAINLFSSPCAPTLDVAIYAFFQATPTLIISLMKPEIIDIGIRHRGRKNRKGRKLRVIPHLIKRDALIEIPVPRMAVFQLAEMAQRVGWYFLVADATEDFVINWMTMAYQWTGCDDPDPPPAATFHLGDTTVWASGAAVENVQFNQGAVTYEHKIIVLPGQTRFRILEPCIPMFTLNAQTKPYAPNPDTKVTSWRVMSNQGSEPILQGRTSGDGSGYSSLSQSSIPIGEYPVNSEFWVEFSKTAGGIGMTDWTWRMTSARSPLRTGFGPDP